MAFSGSADYGATAGDIITEALELLGVLEEGESASTAQNTSSLRTLNNLIKMWNADTQIWAQSEYQLDLVAGQASYTLGVANAGFIPNRVINATLLNATFYDSPDYTLIYDALAVSTYTVGETVTFSGGSTGVVATDDAATTMTIRITEGDTVPADDETMLGGTSGTTSTVNGTPVALAQTGASDEIPIRELSQVEWYSLTDKRTSGRPTQYFQHRQPVGVDHKLDLWPVPDNTTYDLKLWLQYPYQDTDATTDDVWFTQEWFLPLSFMLAYLLSNKYGIGLQERMLLKSSAEDFYEYASTYETEGATYLQPENMNG